MGKPVNLNRFKKQKARAEDKARADENAIRHGLPKSVRNVAKQREKLIQGKLDGNKRDDNR